mgnify:FL=1|jgi:hypothetical protein|tara:strand:+ start:944 stop:1291 length:348 start_codon:yes stop_codon:yes gene_type:complete
MNKHRDPIIEKVINKFSERSNVGYKKYGVTLHDDEPNLHKWLNHIQEELMDAVNYIEKLKMETTDALQEKLLKDYNEDINDIEVNDPITLSAYPEPGPPPTFGTLNVKEWVQTST